jgi:hypothetical protein
MANKKKSTRSKSGLSTQVTNYNDRTEKGTMRRADVDDILAGRRALQDHTPYRNYYVLDHCGRRIGPKQIVHTLLGYAHHGHAAAKALMDLGIKVYATHRTDSGPKLFAKYIAKGLFVP